MTDLFFENPFPSDPPAGWAFDPKPILDIAMASATAVLREWFEKGAPKVGEVDAYTGSCGVAAALLRLLQCVGVPPHKAETYRDGMIAIMEATVAASTASKRRVECCRCHSCA
jgi:hypothetical protein